MKPAFTLGLRGRLILLLLAAFAALAGVIVARSLHDRSDMIAAASEQLMGQAKLITARQQAISARGDALLSSLMLHPELRATGSTDECPPLLSAMLKQQTEFINIGMVLPDGALACSAVPASAPLNFADRYWFRQALQTREMVIGDVVTGRIVGKSVLHFAKAMRDDAGRVSGVLFVALDIAWLERELAKEHLPQGARLMVVDDQGIVAVRHPDPEGWAGRSIAHQPLFKHIRTEHVGEDMVEGTGLDGVRWLYAHEPLLATASGRKYHILLGVPQTVVVAPAQRELAVNLGLALLIIAGALALVVVGGNRLVLRPLLALSRTAARLGAGDLGARSGLPHTDDEVGRLAKELDEGSDRLQASERKLQRANRALRVLYAGNQTLLRVKGEQELLKAMCQAIVEAGGYRIAWIGYTETDSDKSVRPVAAWGDATDFLGSLKISWGETASGRGPTGTAIRRGIPVAVSNAQTDPDYGPWRERAQRYGYASSLALPLRIDGVVIGALNIYAAEPDAFNEDVVELLRESASDLAFGIATQRAQSEHARTQADLKTAEDNFRAAANASLDVLFILASVRDADGRITDFEFTDINAHAEQMLGMAREQVIGQKLCELLPFVRTQGWFDQYAAVVSSGRPLDEEFAVDVPEIKAQWLRQQAVRVDDGVALFMRDVTSWKEAGAALKASEERFRVATANVRDAFIILDGESGRITWWNAAAETIFGYRHDEIIGRPLHDILTPPRFREAAQKGLAHFAVSGEGGAVGKTLELVALKKGGEEFPIELSLSAMQLHDKWFAVGIARDISERKQKETELRMTANRLSEAERVGKLGFLDWNLITNEIEVSDETLRIYGLAPGKNKLTLEEITKLVHPDDVGYAVKSLHDAIEKGTRHDIEHRIVRTDGTVVYVHTPAEVLRDANGKPISVLGTVQDITKRKEQESRIINLNRALRTLSACNLALVHAQTEEELLQNVCRHIVETGGYRVAFIGFAGDDADKTVSIAAQHGAEAGYLESLGFTWADTDKGQGPVGRAIRSGAPQVLQNIMTDPKLAAWRVVAARLENRASISLPFKWRDGKVFGMLTILTAEAEAFDAGELQLLTELADDIVFGIAALRTRAERDRNAYQHVHHAEILQKSLEQSIQAIADTVEARDPYTAGHQRRVSELAVAIARELGLPEEKIHGIHLAATIHDLGKIHIPAEYLSKPGKLTDIEFVIIKTHPQAGYDILKGIEFPWPIADIVRQHHERLDGSGYPQGLKGGQILLESRIMTVADVVEAMASHRPYRPSLGIDSALKEIERGRGTAYDAAVVDACIRLFAEKQFAFSTERAAGQE